MFGQIKKAVKEAEYKIAKDPYGNSLMISKFGVSHSKHKSCPDLGCTLLYVKIKGGIGG